MGRLIRGYDWNKTSLGDPAYWSQSLKTSVRLLLSSGHPMFIWWGKDLLQFYNDAYRRSLGDERHPSALGQRGKECWQEIWDIIGPQIDYVMTGGGHTWHENQLVPITRNGHREDMYWTYSYNPIDDPATESGVGGVLVVCTETTEQVLAEQHQKAAQARWRQLFNQAPGFMCILNGPQHIFEFANPRYFDLIGKRDIIGKSVNDVLPEVARQGFGQLLDSVYRTGQVHTGVATPLTIVQESGAEKSVYIDFVYQPIIDANGQVTGIFVDGYDVTERVRSSEILKTEEKRKDEFLAMLAHELRNPLAPILNAGELLKHEMISRAATHAVGEVISRQVMQLTRLVDDLLDVSRITQGRIDLQKKPMALDYAIQTALDSVKPFMDERHHRISYRKAEQELFIHGDALRIIQCLVNVLNNAAKYTDPGGAIQIQLQKKDDRAEISITDNGIGISSSVLPRVFDLFVQSERPLDRSQGGLGIGLSIVQRLVKMHGGTIEAASAGEQQGATFRFTFPLIATPAHESAEPILHAELPPLCILIVDDNVDAADSLAQLLTLKGHTTSAVYNAQEALELMGVLNADIVLLDIGLPDIDGYEVARRLRAQHNNTVLVALTGYGQADDIQRAMDAGFNAHVTKPVAFDKLEQILEEYC